MELKFILEQRNRAEFQQLLEQNDRYYRHRLQMLEMAASLFQTNKKLSQMTAPERSLFLGQNSNKNNPYEFDVNLFGAPGGNGEVRSVIASKYQFLDDFFAAIPRTGVVTTPQYENLVSLFKQGIEASGCSKFPLVLFTRILTITRPDTFVSSAAKALEPICKALEVKQVKDTESYWNRLLPELHKNELFSESVGVPASNYLALLDGVVWVESENKINEETNKYVMKEPTNKLKQPCNSLNSILYGPPGTGKTYHTIEAAVKAAEPSFSWHSREELKAEYDRLVSDKRIRFVTFHQSYGYEEFVEGLKAESNDDGQISYRVDSGIFKQICEDAQSPNGEHQQFESALEKLKERCLDEAQPLRVTTSNKYEFDVVYRGGKTFLLDPVSTGKACGYSASIENIKKLYLTGNKNGIYNISYVRGLLDYMREHFNLSPAAKHEQPSQPYVLIIDEINRGNISKIFGELITLIEPSKRNGTGEALELVLPYSGDKFSVPSNLYLIGTMNTADRSLAMMDTALRRRFDFVEMMPKPELLESAVVKNIDLQRLLDVLNQRIEILYDREHTLGHAFFMPVKELVEAGEQDKAFELLASVFKNKIIPLLEEYFFEDWSKIRLVLADNQKNNSALEFVVEHEQTKQALDSLFGRHHNLDQYGQSVMTYTLAQDSAPVWKEPSAYVGIYQSVVNSSVDQALAAQGDQASTEQQQTRTMDDAFAVEQ
ncbi:TPA: McrB family protein [Photobacterium damselae]